jgi:large subunit ribosomal protein L23
MEKAKKNTKKVAKTTSAEKTGKVGLAHRVLMRRHLTEKTAIMEAGSKYTFIVSPEANKIMVGEAVREVYGVKPVRVTMVTIPGKEVRRGRQVGRQKDVRKAIVTLKPGTTLPGTEAK